MEFGTQAVMDVLGLILQQQEAQHAQQLQSQQTAFQVPLQPSGHQSSPRRLRRLRRVRRQGLWRLRMMRRTSWRR